MTTTAIDTIRPLFVTGLRNAHALENEALSIMNRQIDRLENYPDMLARLREHRQETEIQQDRLEQILEQLGEDHSSFKDAAASVMGSMAALGHAVAGDEVLKNTFADLAFESYEIASYTSLITLAKAGGFNAAVPLLEETLREEMAMASWIGENVPNVTQRYIALENAGGRGKR